MRFVTFKQGSESRLGVELGERIVDLNRAAISLERERGAVNPQARADAILPTNVLSFLQLGGDSTEAARDSLEHAKSLDPEQASRDLVAIPRDQVRLLPPVPRPPKVVCVARNYAKHAKEAGLELPELPILFPRFASTLIATGDPVIRPTVSDQLDWEGELAVIIGAPGHRIPQEKAIEHVAGYSIFNDVTVRDYQFRVTQYTGGKNFRSSGPFGPALVSADEIGDPHSLDIKTEVNGVVKQGANTDEFIFDIPTIIEHISEFIPLESGDVIATGTPAGVGFKREPAEFLTPGDTVKVTIENVGELENPVLAEEEAW